LNDYAFHIFYKALFEFCSVDLSSFYFDISKDVLYCNDIKDNTRTNKIKVLFQILEKLTTWYAPVLCHTMEEVWQNFKTENLESVHLKVFKNPDNIWNNINLLEKWENIKKIRKIINTAIEIARNDKKIGSSLEANVVLITKEKSILDAIESIEMHNVCIISSFVILDNKDEIENNFISKFSSKEKNIEIYVYNTKYEKCLRCWQYKKEVSANKGLCERCLSVINKNI
jgi:isoleucyl-tRNA synthetase